ncbi:unnamed protein product [Mytilus edulis]|uniref:Uncharacterized protein n=1 Tax=Mytilus edulis TaxID=6550 RepID=A0A8S3R5J2_MYTED|nr:unnamed protein product [Mytilus edulis]
MITTKLTTPGCSTIKTTELTTPGRSTMKTTELTTPGRSTMKTTELAPPRTSTVKTTKLTTPENEDLTTPGRSTTKTKCLCPCSKVGKGKWDFVRGMNLTLDELREILKPDIDLMKKELTVNKSNTTRIRRSKISAPDDRVSATSVGYVGVVFICLITVLICFL